MSHRTLNGTGPARALPPAGPVARRAGRGHGGADPDDDRPTVRHLPLLFSQLAHGRACPPWPSVPFRAFARGEPGHGRRGQAGARGLLRGRATEFVLPKAGAAIVRVLNEAGMDVVFRMPGVLRPGVHANGDDETAAAMARHKPGGAGKDRRRLHRDRLRPCGSARATSGPAWAGRRGKTKVRGAGRQGGGMPPRSSWPPPTPGRFPAAPSCPAAPRSPGTSPATSPGTSWSAASP